MLRGRVAVVTGGGSGIGAVIAGLPAPTRDLDGGFGKEQSPHDLDTIADLLAEALQDATIWLAGELGENMDEWRWERLHVTRPVHPLSAGFGDQSRVRSGNHTAPPCLSQRKFKEYESLR